MVLVSALHAVPGPSSAGPGDPGGARTAVETFAGRLDGARMGDLLVEQTVTLYHPEGRLKMSTGEQRIHLEPPGGLRVDRAVEGQREVDRTLSEHRAIAGPLYLPPDTLFDPAALARER